MSNTKTPIRITPDPITTAVLEVRFKPSVPESTVVGSIYSKLVGFYPNYKNLAIPTEMRHAIPQLKYSSEIEISDDNYIISIGQNVFSQKITNTYLGWDDFIATFNKNFKLINDAQNQFESIERVGLRYINFFSNETDIFECFKLTINFSEKDKYAIEQTNYYTILIADNIKLNLRIQDKAKTIQAEEGLIVDIDSFCQDVNINNFETVVEQLHFEEKQLFFNLLHDELLKKHNPEYGEE